MLRISRIRLGSIERDRQIRAERIRHVIADITRWQGRQASAERQIESLEARLKETRGEIEANADLPDRIDAQRNALLSALSRADEERRGAADMLSTAETAMRAASEALRAIQAEVSSARREANAKIETRLENARQRRQEAARHIRETFEVAPEDCLAVATLPDNTTIPPLADVEKQLTRLKADRERLGGVNLQADEDLVEVSKQLESLRGRAR